MSSEIGRGDRFLLEVEVASVETSAASVRFGFGEATMVSVQTLLASKRLPRPLAVGDRVTWKNDNSRLGNCLWSGTIAYIRDQWAVIDPSTYAHCPATVPLSDLTPAPDKEA